MRAILKKDLCNYFSNPIGYVFFSVFFAISGYLFYISIIVARSSDLSYFFSMFIFTLMFCIPILTMGLFSEEYRLYTDRLLFSSPVSLISIVFGKYISALTIYSIAILISLIYVFVVSLFVLIPLSLVVSCFVGMLLMGVALISIGLFVSVLTKSYIVSAFGTFGFIMFFIFVARLGANIPISWIRKFFDGIAIMPRYNNFNSGVLNIPDVIYFLSVAAVFLFLSVSWLEKKRWS